MERPLCSIGHFPLLTKKERVFMASQILALRLACPSLIAGLVRDTFCRTRNPLRLSLV